MLLFQVMIGCVNKVRLGCCRYFVNLLKVLPSPYIDVKHFAMNSKELLEENIVSKNPIKLFDLWYNEARNTPTIALSHVMTLSTVKKDGRPSSRMVLLQGFSDKGFKFYSSTVSAKAAELETTPFAALVFFWEPLNRSIRLEGKVEMVPSDEADTDFAKRARLSQLSMHVSDKQSQPIENRIVLMERLQQVSDLYADKPIPRPEYIKGFRVVPDQIEFWQGHDSLICDRILFTKTSFSNSCREGDNGWKYLRLGP